MGLKIVEIIMRAEEEFEIEIPDVHAQQLATVGGLADYVASKMARGPSEEIWERVRALVADETSMGRQIIHRESRFVEDLNLG